MTQTLRNMCAMAALPETAPDRIELIPVGAFRTADGRPPFVLDDPAAVIATSFLHAAGGKVLPIDFDHRSFAEQGSADSRAAGWITGLEVEGDRVIALVDWTAEGRAALASRSYRFISPVFKSWPDGRVALIEGAGLVNNPALPQIRQLASKEIQMDLAKEIGGKLGLPADQPAQLVARVIALLGAETQLASILVAGKVAGSGEDAARQICARLITSAADPDPAKFVPMASFTELQTQFASLQKEVGDGKVDAALQLARDEGKLVPADEPWVRNLASRCMNDFEAWRKTAPVRVDVTGQRQLAGRKPPAKIAADGLNSLERQIASRMGVSQEAFLKTRAEKQEA
ncbi:phage protease [Pseudomonas sp. GX19020]|uniref:phage protease n=1 Tax=Pseudomonas sp. GX19020 TaxID=2942277 RepID=UPI002019519D|nr:phage protease [Pseudomonas sp. GX19020]MCL4065920.1 phage protease [Pseudomonas sp. GX19020]